MRAALLTTNLVAGVAFPAGAATCRQLATLSLANTTITLADSVSAGAFKPETPFTEAPIAPNYTRLPAFCRIVATVRPTKDSEIKFEVWLPLAGWNGNFQAVGNGAWSGQIWHPFMASALAAGYATANTDTGHEGSGLDASFALGHPEKVIDFGYRAVHEMTVKSKLIIAAFYGREARVSYWNGCSSGGKQGLKEAQMYPARLRRHHRGRAGEQLDPPHGERHLGGAGDAQGRGQVHPPAEVCHAARSGPRRMRCPRRREG